MDGPYFGLFQEALLNATILPFFTDLYFSAMIAFGTYKVSAMLFLAVSGALIGAVFNWRVGVMVDDGRKNSKFAPNEELFQKCSLVFRRYGIWLLLVSAWLPLGGELLMLLAGLFGVRLWKVLLMVFVDRAFYYTVMTEMISLPF